MINHGMSGHGMDLLHTPTYVETMTSQTREIPPREIINLVAEGTKRTIVKTGGSGSLGITLPKEKLENCGLEEGDQVIIMPGESSKELVILLPEDHA